MAAKILLLGLAAVYACFYQLQDTLRPYTGMPMVDGFITNLVALRWPLHEDLALSIDAIAVQGSINAAWALTLLEGYRRGDRGSNSFSILILFTLLRQFTTGFTISIYCLLHLFLSTTAANPTKQNLFVPRAVLNIIPDVLILGYVIPAATFFSPITRELEESLASEWPFWLTGSAAFIFVVNFALKSTKNTESDSNVEMAETENDDANKDKNRYHRALRCLYEVTLLAASIPHFLALANLLSAVDVHVVTHFREQYLQDLPEMNIYRSIPSVASSLWNPDTPSDIETALGWEYVIMSLALLVWAGHLHSRVEDIDYGTLVAMVLVTGPMGAAVDTLWAREEAVIQKSEAQSTFLRKTRPRGSSGMGKWKGGMKVLALD